MPDKQILKYTDYLPIHVDVQHLKLCVPSTLPKGKET